MNLKTVKMKTSKFSYLIGLLTVGLMLMVFSSCTTEDIAETENLQNFESEADSGDGKGGGKARPVSAMPSDSNNG